MDEKIGRYRLARSRTPPSHGGNSGSNPDSGIYMKEKSHYQFFSTSREAWEAMRQAIKSARHSIYWELYIFRNDEIGKSFLELLKERARAGLEVKLMFDGFGSFWLYFL